MGYSEQKNINFVRPEVAKQYITFGQLSLGLEYGQEEQVTVPALLKVRPLSFNWYPESSSTKNPAAEVVCSGTPLIVNPGNAGARVGILKQDARPGDVASVITSGLFMMLLDYSGDGGSPARTASNLTGLNGKKAYYIAATGTVTDVKPTFADWDFIECGTFRHNAEVKPVNIGANIWYAPVMLDPSLALSKATDNDADLPSNAASAAFGTVHYVSASISDYAGLSQTLSVVAHSTNPSTPIMPEHITWTVEGTVLEDQGREVPATFTAGTGKTISVSVVNGGVTTTKNYTVTISASAAPASFVAV